jgi:hypothetical protein
MFHTSLIPDGEINTRSLIMDYAEKLIHSWMVEGMPIGAVVGVLVLFLLITVILNQSSK